ncbi:MAG: hypothetical protein EOO51_06415 [Flavobacterium sp.]|nr:MAG: hypothetical protein EOO51_06415 [Flavobacterium sp.]
MKIMLIYLFIVFLPLQVRSSTSPSEVQEDQFSLLENANIPLRDRKQLLDRLYFQLLSNPNTKINRKKLFRCLNYFFVFNEWRPLHNATLETLVKCEDVKDVEHIGYSYLYLGYFYMYTNDNRQAYTAFLKAKKLFLSINDSVALCNSYLSIVQLQYYQNDYCTADANIIKAIRLAKQAGDTELECQSLVWLGVISNEFSNFEEARDCFRKAIALNNHCFRRSKFLQVNCLSLIAYSYIQEGESAKSRKIVNYCLKYRHLLKLHPELHARLLDDLAEINIITGHSAAETVQLLNAANQIRKDHNIDLGTNYNALLYSKLYLLNGNTTLATDYSKKAYLISKKFICPGDIICSLKQMINVAPSKPIIQEYLNLSDSLQLAECRSTNQFARIAYEAEELTKEKEQAVRAKNIALGIMIFVALLSTLLIVRLAQKHKQRNLKQLQLQQELDETFFEVHHETVQKVEQARFAEKKRIARELHDGVMNRLSSARLNLYNLSAAKEPADLEKYIGYVNDIKQIEKEIGRIAKNINNVLGADDTSFTSLLENYIKEQQPIMKAKLSISISAEIEWDLVANGLKINIYRIIQESLQNVRKYAQATSASITVEKILDDIHLTITDDGVGFDPETLRFGIGLQNINERAAEFSGAVAVVSKPGEGTKILVRFADSCILGKSA